MYTRHAVIEMSINGTFCTYTGENAAVFVVTYRSVSVQFFVALKQFTSAALNYFGDISQKKRLLILSWKNFAIHRNHEFSMTDMCRPHY